MQPPFPGYITRIDHAHWLRVALLVLTVFLGNFFYLHQFGFYEDDYWAVTPFLEVSFGKILEQFQIAFTEWPQGRPLNHSLPMLFSWLGSQVGLIWGIYLVSSFVILTNSVLLFYLIRLYLGNNSALFGALFYALYPADTTRLFIVHAAHLQTGLTLCLLGLLLVRHSDWRRWLAYPVAGFSLLAYETTFLPFLIGAPFLILLENKTSFWKTFTQHFCSCLAIVACIAAVRIGHQESRANEALGNLTETIWRAVSSLWIGPITSLKIIALTFTQPIATSWLEWTMIALVSCLLFIFLNNQKQEKKGDCRRTILLLLAAGFCIWIGSYGLSIINYPPNNMSGRSTSVHLAGVIGFALIFAGSRSYLLTISGSSWRRYLLAGATSVFIAFILANSFRIQGDYMTAWKIQKKFWSGLVAVVPDLRSGDFVVISGKKQRQPKAMGANSWSDAIILGQLVRFPVETRPIHSFWLHDDSRSPHTFTKEADAIFVRPQDWMPDRVAYQPEQTILLEYTRQGWKRVSSWTLSDGIVIHGRDWNAALPDPPFSTTRLGRLMLRRSAK